MNQHQILTGAVNSGDECYSSGSVEGVPFTAYAAGCNIVILASDFTRVQIIPGILHGNVQVTCLDCSTDVGKIAVCYAASRTGPKDGDETTKSTLCIFEPTPLLDQTSDHKLDYKWIQTASLESDSNIDVLSWNLEGTKLLSGGEVIQMWHLVPDLSPPTVTTTNGQTEKPRIEEPEARTVTPEIVVDEENLKWECVWTCRTASPVCYLKFSPDGSLFVSAGKCDRLVKIWYESAASQGHNPHYNPYHMNNHHIPDESKSHINGQRVTVKFSFVYIAHPRAVTGVSWRKTSKYVPKGCTANILVTSSRDNICRIWVQTLLPDDGMINFNQLDPLSNDTIPRMTTRRHRLKLFSRIRAIRNFNHYKKAHSKKDDETGVLTVGVGQSIKNANGVIDVDNQPIPNLPSTLSVHDFHTYAIHGSAMTPGLHFHLAASINAETDIPLVPSLATKRNGSNKPNFVMHWMNNKEMVFTAKAERILHEASQRIFRESAESEPKSGQGSDVESDVDNISDAGHTDGGHSDGGIENNDETITAESSKKLRHKLCTNSILDGSKSSKKKSKKGDGHKEGTPEDTDSHRPSIHTASSSASLKSELAEKAGSVADSDRTSNGSWGDFVDRKFENMLRDWHGSSDLLFSVHPIDGSLLVWLVDWLDETCPGSFRQAQVNFSSRIPSALPLGDASTMSSNLMLYSPVSYLDLRALSPSNSPKNSPHHQASSSSHRGQRHGHSPTHTPAVSSIPTPIVYMVTKHNNGSLNQWSLTFDEKGNFTQVLSVSHRKRVSGHRFRVNDITCHPVLPLLLTTSHHNLPGSGSLLGEDDDASGHSSPDKSRVPLIETGQASTDASMVPNTGFCSELILWKVDSVGPLSKSGGVTELARINSFEIAAFANVAWIPTLLPSSTLGSLANSPSACFIASDGKQLRVYQAVIDARTILAEVSAAERRSQEASGAFSDDNSSDAGGLSKHYNLAENFKIVSLQSTSRPGCIIELSEINDAIHDWQNTQLLHIFQDQLIKGDKVTLQSWSKVHGQQDVTSPGLVEPSLGAVVDLRHSAVFEEPFYLVVLEKNSESQSVIHMWKLVISSQTADGDENGRYNYVPDSNLIQESDHSNASSRSGTPDGSKKHGSHKDALQPLKITTTKVVTQVLPLPADVEVLHATPAAGHLPSSNIYPACFAPYLLCTACSDGVIRFWRCQVNTRPADDPCLEGLNKFKWMEWEMLLNKSPSSIEVPGLPLYVSCAYSGRMAVAYKHGAGYTKPNDKVPGTKYININLNIYECESTGGSEWILEDTIKMKNVEIPRIQVDNKIDLEPLIVSSIKNKRKVDALVSRLHSDDTCDPHAHVHEVHDRTSTNLHRMVSVPSYTTMSTLKKIITEKGNQFTLAQKSLIQLDWVSTEDGSHALTVSIGNRISVFTPVSTDIAQANMQAMKASSKTGTTNTARQLLKQASSMVTAGQPDDLKWMAIRTTKLKTADGLPPLPMQMSWVRDGILVVGMDNEMHIYTQWKSTKDEEELLFGGRRQSGQVMDPRVLKENQLLSKAAETASLRIPSHNIPKSASSTHIVKDGAKSPRPPPIKTELSDIPENRDSDQRESILCQLPDFGIFEASRLACPVLPQYHPKQLMELLSFGKIHRVRAILRHLTMSLCSMDSLKSYVSQQYGKNESIRSPRPYRSRTLSVSAPPGSNTASPAADFGDTGFPDVPEEVQLEYTEITSIRPLPLFTLVDAEFSQTKGGLERSKNMSESDSSGYGGLFDTGTKSQVEETLDEILNRSTFNFNKEDRNENIDLNNFGPRQSRLLTKLLTHSHLPGLSSTDQMHLLALADAVASFNPEKSSRQDDEEGEGNSSEGGMDVNVSTDSLDDCGLRFLLTMRQHTYLLRCLPMNQRKLLHKEGISTSNMVWAFHSETQEELIQLIVSLQRNQLKWSSLRELGVGWWVRNNNVLRRLIEQVAKSSFQCKNDPLDAALFYLAMKKKSLVWGLYRSINDPKMTDFFSHNFSEDKWRKAALKNAYALLGKQRFEHATAFFLLAGNLWDAVETCLSKLDDVQLAIVIVRLYEGDIETVPETLKKILYKEALGRDKNGENYHGSKAHPDPFLRSMAYWMLQDYSFALTTLLDTDLGYDHPKNVNEGLCKEDFWVPPSVFNFYLYLRTQPLILRRARTAAGGASGGGAVTAESMAEAITPFERRLFFITAHQHFRAGCPSLALEVLSRLPGKIVLDDEDPFFGRRDSEPTLGSAQASFDETITSGAIANGHLDSASSFDWGAPSVPAATTDDSAGAFDWGAPVTDMTIDTTYKIDINIDSGSEEDDGEGLMMKEPEKKETKSVAKLDIPAGNKESKDIKLDIMAQQLKFVACLKIIMEELSTLATGYEVDGGQLRYYLYVWLEKSVNALKTICSTGSFSMRGNTYKSFDGQTTSSVFGQELYQESRVTPRGSHSSGTSGMEPKPTLHEILLSDKMDFEAKLERSKKRKEWLRANEALLRTLLSYCSLHGAHGGGLASVRMELILLLQELQQERTQHQLLSPLPFPTTLPLLAASVACQKTVIADPLRHLSSMITDVLDTVTSLSTPPFTLPSNYSEIYVLRDLGTSLSACIYQSLCDSDNLQIKPGKDTDPSIVCPNSHLLAGHIATKRASISEASKDLDPVDPTTAPNKWPGVQSLRALLARDKDEDSPKLHTLLCEAYFAVYQSQLLWAFAACDSHMLYRLVAKDFSEKEWSSLFGGGAKKLIHVAVAASRQASQSGTNPNLGEDSKSPSVDLFNTLSKQRMKLHMKILQQLNTPTAPGSATVAGGQPGIPGPGSQPSVIKEDRPTYREQFVPPKMSILSCLMSKPRLPDELIVLDYDSSESVASEEEEEDDRPFDENAHDPSIFGGESGSVHVGSNAGGEGQVAKQLSDHEKYAWGIIRCAVLKLALIHLEQFLVTAGVELNDLPTVSPNIQSIFKSMNHWIECIKKYMDELEGPPIHFLPNVYVESIRAPGTPAINKYRALLELNNTPFKAHNSITKPAKRLWNYLVRRPQVQAIFVRYVFGKPKSNISADSFSDLGTDGGHGPDGVDHHSSSIEIVKIVHRDADQISSFCINAVNGGMMAIATPKEIQELNITPLLDPVPWLEEEAEYDIKNLLKAPEQLPNTDYLVVQHPSDKYSTSPGRMAMQLNVNLSAVGSKDAHHDKAKAHIMMKRHRTEGTRRMAAHPTLPLYVSGSQDGSVTLWEWNHQMAICTPRSSGTFGKVTHLEFNQHGNKFGVSDGDGNLSLWQVAVSSTGSKPFYSSQVHTQLCSDFSFLGSSSLLVTAGTSKDHRNICLWDTLLPTKKSLVKAFNCHEQHGAAAVIYAPLNQVLITGGRKGFVFIFDMRQRTQRHKFQAHESAVKCLALDPSEEFFVSGSADGDLKVWSLGPVCLPLYSFPGEHTKSSLFRNIGMGVSHIHVDQAARLYSCGADGSLKLRQLPDRNSNDIVLNFM